MRSMHFMKIVHLSSAIRPLIWRQKIVRPTTPLIAAKKTWHMGQSPREIHSTFFISKPCKVEVDVVKVDSFVMAVWLQPNRDLFSSGRPVGQVHYRCVAHHFLVHIGGIIKNNPQTQFLQRTYKEVSWRCTAKCHSFCMAHASVKHSGVVACSPLLGMPPPSESVL